MCWKLTCPMDEKMNFIKAWKSQQYTVSALCRAHGISRTTGHRLIKRFNELGEAAFEVKSKRPRNSPNKTPEKIEKAIVKLRNKYKLWGARKLVVLLQDQFDEASIPSETTVYAILNRNGLIKKQRKRPHRIEKLNPYFDPKKPNEIWSADYKGKFRLGNRRYCHPLTISDKKSRFVFTAKGHYNTNYEAVKQEYIRVFKEFGKPKFIHTDNGVPFGAMRAVNRFSKLSYWLIDHGVYPLFSDPASPQQNGRHERMHRDLKDFCTKPPMNTLTKQQELMDAFVKQFNEVRPHEALNMKTPASQHTYSKRTFNDKVKHFDYDYGFMVRKVTKNGAIRWKGYNFVFISSSAARRYVGVREIGNGIHEVFYRDVFLGYFDVNNIKRKEQHLKLSKKLV